LDIFFQYLVVGLLEGGLYALVGVSIVLVYKSTHVASLAHGHLLAFGALFFFFFYSWLSLPLPIALVLAFAVNCILGLCIERFALRPLIGQSHFAAFLVTFSIFLILDGVYNIFLQGSIINFPDFLPPGRLVLASSSIPWNQLISFMASLVLFGLLGLFFRMTKAGLNMLATAENHQLAQSAGINVRKTFSYAWGLSAVVSTVAGMATANVMEISYSLPYIGIKGLIVALFGGLDSIRGALLGGLILGILENVAAGYIDPVVGGGVKEVAAYAMLLVILMVRPYGLFGQIRIERI
jgi:branched-chain amino acid transport system permease protein